MQSAGVSRQSLIPATQGYIPGCGFGILYLLAMMQAASFAYDQILNNSAMETAVVDAIGPNGTWSAAGKPGTEARLSGMQLSRPLCESQDSTGRWIGRLGAGRS